MLALHSPLLIGAVLLTNFVVLQYTARPLASWAAALAAAAACAAVPVAALTLYWPLRHFALQPLGLQYLQLLILLPLIAALTELAVQAAPALFPTPAEIPRPLTLSHSALLGIALAATSTDFGFLHTLAYGIGTALAMALLLPLFFGLRERIAGADLPKPFRGAAVDMISAGLIALAFAGFAGLL